MLGASLPFWRELFLLYAERPLSADAVVWVACALPHFLMLIAGVAAWPIILPADPSTSEEVEAGSTDEGEEVRQAGTS
jgi:hypothetical protein